MMNNTSDITSTRNLKDLVEKGIMKASGVGRSVKYKVI